MDEQAEEEIKQLIETNANDTRVLANLIANRTEIISAEFGILHNKAYQLDTLTQKLTDRQNIQEHQITLTAAKELFTENVLQ